MYKARWHSTDKHHNSLRWCLPVFAYMVPLLDKKTLFLVNKALTHVICHFSSYIIKAGIIDAFEQGIWNLFLSKEKDRAVFVNLGSPG